MIDGLRRLLPAALLLVGTGLQAQQAATRFTALAFDDPVRDVRFLAQDLASGQRWAVAGSDTEPGELEVRWPPFSTFKIPNLLIALDTGAADSLDHVIEWDPASRPAAEHWPAGWAQAQSLRSAFRRSAVWYFRDLALAIGGPAYRDRLTAFRYGNAAAPDGSDLFWLDGRLRISVREQVEFLAALLQGELDVSERAVEALRDASRVDERDGHVLHGKTGAGPADDGNFDGPFRGWFVGWVERPRRDPVVFALFVDGPDWGSIARFRRAASEALLVQAGVWPEG